MLVPSWKSSLRANFLEHFEHAGISFFDIILRSSVIWVNPGVSIGVEVDDKLDLLFVVFNKLFKSL